MDQCRGRTVPRGQRRVRATVPKREGWKGWDEYAPFYDWENARTLGRKRREIPGADELEAPGAGCSSLAASSRPDFAADSPAQCGPLVGLNRSDAMLGRAARRAETLLLEGPKDCRGACAGLVRGDIRAVAVHSDHFQLVLAPYGILQSLFVTGPLTATLARSRA